MEDDANCGQVSGLTEFFILSSRTQKKAEPTKQNQDQPHPTTQRIQSMSGRHQLSASTRDIERNISEAKQFARDAFNKRTGTQGFSALQKAFYNRFLELEAQTWDVNASTRSSSSSAPKPPSTSPHSLLNAKLGNLRKGLSPTFLRLVSHVR